MAKKEGQNRGQKGEREVQIRSAKQHFFYGVYGTFGGEIEGWEWVESYIGGIEKRVIFGGFFWASSTFYQGWKGKSPLRIYVQSRLGWEGCFGLWLGRPWFGCF